MHIESLAAAGYDLHRWTAGNMGQTALLGLGVARVCRVWRFECKWQHIMSPAHIFVHQPWAKVLIANVHFYGYLDMLEIKCYKLRQSTHKLTGYSWFSDSIKFTLGTTYSTYVYTVIHIYGDRGRGESMCSTCNVCTYIHTVCNVHWRLCERVPNKQYLPY